MQENGLPQDTNSGQNKNSDEPIPLRVSKMLDKLDRDLNESSGQSKLSRDERELMELHRPETDIEIADKVITPAYQSSPDRAIVDPETREILAYLPELFTHDLITARLNDWDREVAKDYINIMAMSIELILDGGIPLFSTLRDEVLHYYSIINLSKCADGWATEKALEKRISRTERHSFSTAPLPIESDKKNKNKGGFV